LPIRKNDKERGPKMRIAIEDKESLENLKVLEKVRSESPTELVRLALRLAAQQVIAEELEKIGAFQREMDTDLEPDMMQLQGFVTLGKP
jgi:hypothetical protein